MSEINLPLSIMEPFNVGRSAYRLFFDFGILLSCFSSSPNKRVLDFGAGTGWISEFLARLGYEVYAIDVDAGMPGSVKSRLMADRRLALINIQTVISSGMALPFPDGFFSHICCFDTLHHMTDYPLTFREMSRVLELGGRAVFIEPGARHSHSKETIAFMETYKKDDPTWIERDVVLEEIAEISKESGFSKLMMLPVLLPGLRTYTASEWDKFRKGDHFLIQDYISLFKDFNYGDHLSFYCEKLPASNITETSSMDLSQKKLTPLFRKKIAVDLTPMLPGGENGGAKPMILALLKHLPLLMSDCEFVLLTSSSSHDDLAYLDRPNLSRLCVHQSVSEMVNVTPSAMRDQLYGFAHRLFQSIRRHLPQSMILYLKDLVYGNIKAKPLSPSLLGRLKVDLLFCPFTAPVFRDPQVPTISLLHDLQFKSYPQFFQPDDLFQRERNFQETTHKANYIVTVSDFVRNTVLEHSNVPASRIITIHHGQVQDFQYSKNVESQELLQRLKVKPNCYLFYPANFWQHKNHAMLLTAFRLFVERHPETDIKLVCTGALESQRAKLMRATQVMGISERVVFPGYLPTSEIGSLYQHALALIFPSLYEGFGIPLLEAFAAGTPVLCSNVTSLPEVGGNAVLYFDPFKPYDIVSAIEKIVSDVSFRADLIQKGTQRLILFGGAERMSREYVELLTHALVISPEYTRFEFVGVTGDGWLQEQASLLKPQTAKPVQVEIRCNIPPWVNQPLQVEAFWEKQQYLKWELLPGKEHILALDLPVESGCLLLEFAPGFIPVHLGIGEDERLLSAQCIECQVRIGAQTEILFPPQKVELQP